jgi:ribosome-associated protein
MLGAVAAVLIPVMGLLSRSFEDAKATDAKLASVTYGGRMPDSLRVSDELELPLDEVEVRASRSSGPGGQHANVTASRIEAAFDVEASETLSDEQRELLLRRLGPHVTAVAQDARSQARNRELALERLVEKLAGGLRRPKPRRPTKPSRGARERRLEQKRRTSERKAQRRRPSDY